MEKVGVVVTVKNDPEGEKALLEGLKRQTKKPDEIIVVRAEENHNCSRAVGRNLGISQASSNIIAITDVGCDPHPGWLEKLTENIDGQETVVVAGLYRVRAKTVFQQAIAPFLAIYPVDKGSDQTQRRIRSVLRYAADRRKIGSSEYDYLPASRSIAFTKKAWEMVGGYPEEAMSAAEDIAFAGKLYRNPQIKKLQAPEALVDWEPPTTLGGYLGNIRDHTLGNFQANYQPHIKRNLLTVARWILFIVVPWLFVPYLAWPIYKHWSSLREGSDQAQRRIRSVLLPRQARDADRRKIGSVTDEGSDPSRLTVVLLQPVVQVMTDVVIIVTILEWAVSKLWLKVLGGSRR